VVQDLRTRLLTLHLMENILPGCEVNVAGENLDEVSVGIISI